MPSLEDLIEQQDNRCFLCKQEMLDPTREHVIPLSSKEHSIFLLQSARNQVATCRGCNHVKVGRMPTDTELKRLVVLKRQITGEAERGEWLKI